MQAAPKFSSAPETPRSRFSSVPSARPYLLTDQNSVSLNPDFNPGLNEKWGRDFLLTASSYPLVRTGVDAPVCLLLSQVNEAMDAWRAGDRRWLDSLKSCFVLPEGTDAEWTRYDAASEYRVVRLALPDGSRKTVTPNPGSAWGSKPGSTLY